MDKKMLSRGGDVHKKVAPPPPPSSSKLLPLRLAWMTILFFLIFILALQLGGGNLEVEAGSSGGGGGTDVESKKGDGHHGKKESGGGSDQSRRRVSSKYRRRSGKVGAADSGGSGSPLAAAATSRKEEGDGHRHRGGGENTVNSSRYEHGAVSSSPHASSSSPGKGSGGRRTSSGRIVESSRQPQRPSGGVSASTTTTIRGSGGGGGEGGGRRSQLSQPPNPNAIIRIVMQWLPTLFSRFKSKVMGYKEFFCKYYADRGTYYVSKAPNRYVFYILHSVINKGTSKELRLVRMFAHYSIKELDTGLAFRKEREELPIYMKTEGPVAFRDHEDRIIGVVEVEGPRKWVRVEEDTRTPDPRHKEVLYHPPVHGWIILGVDQVRQYHRDNGTEIRAKICGLYRLVRESRRFHERFVKIYYDRETGRDRERDRRGKTLRREGLTAVVLTDHLEIDHTPGRRRLYEHYYMVGGVEFRDASLAIAECIRYYGVEDASTLAGTSASSGGRSPNSTTTRTRESASNSDPPSAAASLSRSRNLDSHVGGGDDVFPHPLPSPGSTRYSGSMTNGRDENGENHDATAASETKGDREIGGGGGGGDPAEGEEKAEADIDGGHGGHNRSEVAASTTSSGARRRGHTNGEMEDAASSHHDGAPSVRSRHSTTFVPVPVPIVVSSTKHQSSPEHGVVEDAAEDAASTDRAGPSDAAPSPQDEEGAAALDDFHAVAMAGRVDLPGLPSPAGTNYEGPSDTASVTSRRSVGSRGGIRDDAYDAPDIRTIPLTCPLPSPANTRYDDAGESDTESDTQRRAADENDADNGEGDGGIRRYSRNASARNSSVSLSLQPPIPLEAQQTGEEPSRVGTPPPAYSTLSRHDELHEKRDGEEGEGDPPYPSEAKKVPIPVAELCGACGGGGEEDLGGPSTPRGPAHAGSGASGEDNELHHEQIVSVEEEDLSEFGPENDPLQGAAAGEEFAESQDPIDVRLVMMSDGYPRAVLDNGAGDDERKSPKLLEVVEVEEAAEGLAEEKVDEQREAASELGGHPRLPTPGNTNYTDGSVSDARSDTASSVASHRSLSKAASIQSRRSDSQSAGDPHPRLPSPGRTNYTDGSVSDRRSNTASVASDARKGKDSLANLPPLPPSTTPEHDDHAEQEDEAAGDPEDGPKVFGVDGSEVSTRTRLREDPTRKGEDPIAKVSTWVQGGSEGGEKGIPAEIAQTHSTTPPTEGGTGDDNIIPHAGNSSAGYPESLSSGRGPISEHPEGSAASKAARSSSNQKAPPSSSSWPSSQDELVYEGRKPPPSSGSSSSGGAPLGGMTPSAASSRRSRRSSKAVVVQKQQE